MTAVSAAGSPRSAGRCTSTPSPASGRDADAASFAALAGVVQRIPDDAVVLLDGLVASTAPEVLVPQARRLRLVVLVHMPLGHRPADDGADEPARGSARSSRPPLPSSRRARGPGAGCSSCTRCPPTGCTSPSPVSTPPTLATGTATGGALLCVAAVTFDKGHDVLLDALAAISDLSWQLRVRRQPGPRPGVRRGSPSPLAGRGLGDRVSFPGPRTGADLDRSYAAADLMVLASRAETYGMVVTEALARGLPVIAAEVGGVTEALGHGADGIRPGLLVPPDDPAALGAALRAWLGDAELRARLRRAARERRESLPGWSTTASVSQASWPGRRDERRRSSGSAGNGLPSASPLTPRPVHATSSSTSASAPGDRPLGDPRPRRRHRGDGPLARAAAARAAALGRARPRRRPAGARRRRAPRPGRRRGRGHRRGEALRHHPAARRAISPMRP